MKKDGHEIKTRIRWWNHRRSSRRFFSYVKKKKSKRAEMEGDATVRIPTQRDLRVTSHQGSVPFMAVSYIQYFTKVSDGRTHLLHQPFFPPNQVFKANDKKLQKIQQFFFFF